MLLSCEEVLVISKYHSDLSGHSPLEIFPLSGLIWRHDTNEWEVLNDDCDLCHSAPHDLKTTEPENCTQILFFSSHQIYKILGGIYGFY